MSTSSKRFFFGIYGMTLYNRTTAESYGMMNVLGEAALNFSGDLVQLYGGAQKFPWSIEEGKQKGELSVKLKEYPKMLWQLLQGKLPTETLADGGQIANLANISGDLTGVATGIDSVGVIPTTGAANLKFGRYLIKAVSGTTVDVYAMTDVNFARGSAASIVDDYGKVTSSPLTITSSGNIDIDALGIRLVGGSGTIGMTAGDTATFDVLPPSTVFNTVRVGGASDVYPEFGAILVGKPVNSGKEIIMVDIFRCKGLGLPFQLQENAFSQTDLKLECFQDSAKNGVYDMTWISTT